MKKIAILLIALMVICVGLLSGCTNSGNGNLNDEKSEGSSVLTKTYYTVDEMMEAIYEESIDYRGTVTNIANYFKSENEVINYDTSQFLIHKEQLNGHDLTTFDRFGNYRTSRAELIQGLEYITNKDYENAWSYIDRADGEVWYISYYTHYSVIQDFGLEELGDFCYSLYKN
jgi:predicted small secreted protein